MSEHTVTRSDLTCTTSRAARELELRRGEFELAMHLGRIRTVPDEGGGGRRVPYAEIERLRSAPDHPEGLRQSLSVVGTSAGAGLLEVPATRFTRFARVGLVTPVRFYLNRYRAVVWLYLADELRQFAAEPCNASLLKGRMLPDSLRGRIQAGVDLRPRNWRGRHVGFLLRQAEDPWRQAGVFAALLGPGDPVELVPDPYERAHLNRFRPSLPAHGTPGSPAARVAERIMRADEPDEVAWLRAELIAAVEAARLERPAPRPTPRRTAAPAPPPASAAAEPGPGRGDHPGPKPLPGRGDEVAQSPLQAPARARGGLLGRLRRGRARIRRGERPPRRA
ncbi:DUF6397 family protein [Streptomyces sp. NPDC058739]|uniref:DUF6397 family protein n=1 Tax=Streptomyces sp. NPDC058739 TaxID=3346618 RepID=UPI0036C6B00E